MSISAVFVPEIGRVTVEPRVLPVPGPGEVRIKTTLAGICGSDTHAVAGEHPLLPPPYFPGHEATGTVSALGEGVTEFEVGQRVILKPNVACGECVNCVAGRTNACQRLQWIGCDPSGALPGAMSEEFLAPKRNVFATPDDVTDDQAVLVECLATPMHAARIAGDLSGQRVAVLGAGTIGLLSVIAARHAGASLVLVTDLDASKRERALRHGADVSLDPTPDGFPEDAREALGGEADVVFDCVANAQSVRQALSLLRRAGTLLIVGVPPGDVAIPLALVQDWEIRVQGCANYTELDFEAAIRAGSALPASEIISSRFAFDDAKEAFEIAASFSSGKVVVGPGASA